MNTSAAALTNALHLPLRGVTWARPNALYLLVVIALLLVWWLWQARTPLRSIAPVLRAIVLVLFVLALADPHTVTRSEGSARPAIIDASFSITPQMRAFTADLLRNRLKLRSGDPAIIFADSALDDSIGDALSVLTATAGCAGCIPTATNLEAALNQIAARAESHGGPIVLVTDGWQNHGEATNAVGALRAAGIQLDIFTPPGAQAIANLAMTQLNLPPALAKAEPFALGVTMTNLNAVPAAGTITIVRNGQTLDQRSVSIAPGQTRFDFPVHSENAGLVNYRAVFKPANPALDAYPEDDSLQGWVGIGAQRKVLILTGTQRDANYLGAIVRRLGMDPTTVVVGSGVWNGSPKGYDAVILNNVARAHVAPAAQSALAQYADEGGSLAMVGGDQSFGLGGWQDTPLARVMPVIMKPPQRHERKRALLLIIDKSGSMGRNEKLDYAKAAALTVIKTLNDSDSVGVIGFDSQPFVVIPLEPVSQSRPYFSELIDRLKARGTTFLMPALQEAQRSLAQSGTAIKHVVILTDGETGGTAAMYYDLVSSMHREGGVTISAIAIGREANFGLLQSISKYGGGGFYQTDSPTNLPQLFLEDVRQRGGDTTMVEKDFVPYSVSPDPLLKELAGRQLPALTGFVSTDLKPGATLSVFVNSGGVRAPVVASWKIGAGKALAVTTDASGRWSSRWVENGVFGSLWDKLVAWMTPQTGTAAQKFDVALGYRSGRIEIKLTDYSDTLRASGRPIEAVVRMPDGSKANAILAQNAPGELSGSLEATKPGNYYIELRPPPGTDQTFPPLAYTVSSDISAESPRPAPNYGLLEQLASATGGRLNPSPQELAMSRPQFEHTASFTPWLVVTAMILLIAEALIRRLTF
ncbi:MAG TPA: VWA domain-containing protein [Candidatus Binataceae bacterium]|nr:VWA domain-containing protein [Candidatus Binataceae bacterium]